MANQLNANFTAAYESLANGRVLNTDAEGVQIGALTVLEASDGAVHLQGGVLRLTPASSPSASLGDQGAYGAAITRAAGTALLGRVRNINLNVSTAAYNGSYLGWWDGQTCNAADRVYAMWHSIGSGTDSLLVARVADGAGTSLENLGAQKWGTGSINEVCMTLGGCTAGGVPYQGGDASTYTYGCQFLARGGDRVATRLVWVADAQNQATLYPTFTTNSGPCELADMAVTAADSDNLVQPTSYTASPTAGTTFTCLADALVSWYVTRPASGTLTLALRYADDSNYIGVSVASDGTLTLFSRAAGSNTTIQATASGTIASGDSRIVVTMDGTELKVYRANASTTLAIASGTSSVQQTTAGGKLIGVGTSGAAAKLAAFPRSLSSSPIDTRYGAYAIAGLDNRTEDAARAAIISAIWSGSSLPTDGLGVTRASTTSPLATYSLDPTNLDTCYLYDNCDFGGPASSGTTRNRDIYLWTPTSGTANGRLVVFGTGHTADLTALNLGLQGACIKAMVEEGYAVAWVMMPGGTGSSVSAHQAYPQPTDSANYLRYFIEPYVRTLNELIATYPDRPCIGGLSGGGWSSILTAAIDPRFRASVPVAGGLWLGYPDANFGQDWEQFLPGMGDLRLDYPDLYRLACTGGRTLLQYNNTLDAGTFTKADYDAAFAQYGPLVATATGDRYSITWDSPGTNHEITAAGRAAMLAAFGAATEEEEEESADGRLPFLPMIARMARRR